MSVGAGSVVCLLSFTGVTVNNSQEDLDESVPLPGGLIILQSSFHFCLVYFVEVRAIFFREEREGNGSSKHPDEEIINQQEMNRS